MWITYTSVLHPTEPRIISQIITRVLQSSLGRIFSDLIYLSKVPMGWVSPMHPVTGVAVENRWKHYGSKIEYNGNRWKQGKSN